MKIFIIIKENSKRVSGKNFKLLGDLELWKHLVYELKGHKVYIDTDSSEILEECTKLSWVTSYQRKQSFVDFENDDSSNLSPALLMIDNFLDTYVDDDNEIIITTHVTSPFLKIDTILDAVKILEESDHDSVHSVTKHHEFSWLGEDMTPINFKPDVVQKTQDLPVITMSNGGFFIFRKRLFKKVNNRIGTNPYYYKLGAPEDIEIDNMDDFKLAELVERGLCS